MSISPAERRLATWVRSEGPRAQPLEAAAGGAAAALVAGLAMGALRSTLQVRTVPERLMEWLLLFISPDLFEAMLRRFGFDAKRYALDAAVLLLLLLLGGLGYVVLRCGWSAPAIAVLGLAFWLMVMLVVMPLTSAGIFAKDLLEGQWAAIGGYLAVGLTYAAVLSVAHLRLLRLHHAGTSAQGDPAPRRVALGLLGGTVAAFAATYVAGRLVPRQSSAPTVLLVDPQEPVPSGGLDEPNPHPNAVTAPAEAAPAQTVPAAPGNLPEPGPARALSRDQDGAVLPSGRRPGELAPAMTASNDFYIVTKNAGGDPIIHPEEWRLLVDGDVGRAVQLEYATLRRLPSVQVTKTLECISNMVGKPELAPFGAELISTSVWRGVRVRDILALAEGARPTAEWVAILAADEFTSSLPLEVVLDPATLLVYELNGEVLPREHGYPARLLVPDRYGMKNPKWVVGLRPMQREFLDWYAQRRWSRQGVVRTMCRIDTPAPGTAVRVGSFQVAGVAYAGSRQIRQVEVSSDGGENWLPAELLDVPAPGEDRWVRWQAQVMLASARARILARATDGTGQLQTEAFALPQPDGGTGWPSVEVEAT